MTIHQKIAIHVKQIVAKNLPKIEKNQQQQKKKKKKNQNKTERPLAPWQLSLYAGSRLGTSMFATERYYEEPE